jgi:hypothetical protein
MRFLYGLSKNRQITNFVKIRPVGAELLHGDGQTHMKAVAAYRSFAKAPKNQSVNAV